MADPHINNVVFHSHFDSDGSNIHGFPVLAVAGDEVILNTSQQDDEWHNVSCVCNMSSEPAGGKRILDVKTGIATAMQMGSFVTNNVKMGTSRPQFPGGVTGTYALALPQSSAFAFGSQDFTIEFWMYAEPVSDVNVFPIDGRVNDAWATNDWTISIKHSDVRAQNNISLWAYNLNSGPAIAGTIATQYNTWMHIQVSRKGNTFYLFVDGVLSGSTTSAAAFNSSVSDGLYVSSSFKGSIQGLRVTKNVCRHDTAFVPEASEFTDKEYDELGEHVVCLMDFNAPDGTNAYVDHAGGAWVGSGAVISANQGRNGKSALNLTTSGAHLVTNSSLMSAGGFDYDDFTIEAWVKFPVFPTGVNVTSNAGLLATIFSHGIYGTTSFMSHWIGQSNMGGSTTGTSGQVATGAHGMVVDTWYHVALTRYNGTCYSFVNGALIASSPASNTVSFTSSSSIYSWIGRNAGYSNPSGCGYIDQIRVTEGKARYTSNFDVSAKNVVNFLPIRPRYTGSSDVTPRFAGGDWPPVVSSVKRNGRQTLKFNRNNHIMAVSRTTAGGVSKNDFTFGAWIYIDSFNSSGGGRETTIFETAAVSQSNNYNLKLYANTITVYNGSSGSNYSIVSQTGIAVKTWTHVAMVRSGKRLRCFINGVPSAWSAVTDADINSENVTLFGASASVEGSGRGFSGSVSDAFFELGHARWTDAFTPPETLPDFSVPYIKDEKGNNVIPFSIGTPVLTSNAPRHGQSCLVCDGSSGAYVPHTAALNMGSDDWTLEFWMKPANMYVGQTKTVMARRATATKGWDVRMTDNVVYMHFGNGTYACVLNSQTALAANVWHHIAITRQQNTHRIYINGHCEGEINVEINYDISSSEVASYYLSNPFMIGTSYMQSGGFIGWIDEVRLTKGVCRYVMPAYDAVLGDPLWKATAAYMTMDGAIIDALADKVAFQLKIPTAHGSSAFTDVMGRGITVSNVTSSTVNALWGKSSAYFAGGSTNYIWMNDNSGAEFNLSNTDWTLETWAFEQSALQSSTLISMRTGGTDGWAWRTHSLRAIVNGSWSDMHLSWDRPSADTWHHYALQKRGSVLEMYVDGRMVSTLANVSTFATSTAPIRIGVADAAGDAPFKGFMQDMRLTRGTCRYSGSFVPPGAAFNFNDINHDHTVLAMPLDGGIDTGDAWVDNVIVNMRGSSLKDDCGNQVTVSSGAAVNQTGGRTGGACIEMPTASSSIQIATSGNMAFTGDFCVEMWIKQTQVAGNWIFGGGANCMFVTSDAQLRHAFGIYGVQSVIIASDRTTAPVNQWYHLAISREAGTVRMFIDGNLVAQASYAAAIVAPVAAYTFAGWTGYLSDVRMTNGSARYTASFSTTDISGAPYNPVLDSHPSNVVLWVKPELNQNDSLAENVVMQVMFNEPMGSTYAIKDDAGHLVYVNGSAVIAACPPGRAGRCLYVNGNQSSVSSSDASYLLATGDFTVEAWVHPQQGGHASGHAWSRLIAFGYDGTYGGMYLNAVSTDNPMRLRLEGYNGSYVTLVPEPSATISDAWHHIAVTRKNGVFSIWVDGGLYAQQAVVYNITQTYVIIGESSGNSDFTGWIDDFRLTKGVARYDAPYLMPVSYGSLYTVDRTGKVNNMLSTTVPDAYPSSTNKKYGSMSVRFNGGSNIMAFEPSSDFDFTNADWTMEMWINPDDQSNMALLSFATGYHLGIMIISKKLALYVSSTGASWDMANTDTGLGVGNVEIQPNTWTHVVVQRNAGRIDTFINGELDACVNVAAKGVVTRNERLYLGKWKDSSSYPYKGYIDDLVITKGVARYPRTTQVTTSVLDNQFADKTGAQVSSYNVIPSSAVAMYGSKSAFFNGTDARILNEGTWNIGTQDYSIEFWMHPTEVNGTWKFILDTRVEPADTGLAVLITGAGNKLALFTNNVTKLTSTSAIQPNTWTHVLIARKSGYVRMWINGQQEAIIADQINHIVNGPVRIGYSMDTSLFFKGYLQDMRVVTGATSSNEPVFTIPEMIYLDNMQLVEHTKGTVVTVNGGQFSTDSKHGNASMKFMRAVNSIVLANKQSHMLYGSMTVDAWVKPTAVNGVIWNSYSGSSNCHMFGIDGNGKLAITYSSAWSGYSIVTSSTNVPLNTWSHVAFVKNGTLITLYINGVASGSATYGISNMMLNPMGTGMTFGSINSSIQFQGWMDDVRVTNAARWSGNFTPPGPAEIMSSRAAFYPPTGAYPHASGEVTGNVFDENGLPAVRRVMSYDRSTGKLLGDTYSNVDGSYALPSPASQVFVIALDDDAGNPLNAVVEDRITPS